jgi:hypothetical protein
MPAIKNNAPKRQMTLICLQPPDYLKFNGGFDLGSNILAKTQA